MAQATGHHFFRRTGYVEANGVDGRGRFHGSVWRGAGVRNFHPANRVVGFRAQRAHRRRCCRRVLPGAVAPVGVRVLWEASARHPRSAHPWRMLRRHSILGVPQLRAQQFGDRGVIVTGLLWNRPQATCVASSYHGRSCYCLISLYFLKYNSFVF